MNNDAVQRLREPGAWVLLGSVALQILAGLIGLLFRDRDASFTFVALKYMSEDHLFAGISVVGLVVLAVLLATRLGGAPTPQARTVVLAGTILLGTVALLDVVCMLAGLAAAQDQSGVLLDGGFAAKIGMFLYGIAKIAVVGVGGYYVYAVLQSFGPAVPSGPQYQQQAYGQGRPPYVAQGYGPPQQPYGAPHQQPYGGPQQQYAQQEYAPPRQPYAPPGYGQPYQQGPQQPPRPAPAQPGQPPQGGAPQTAAPQGPVPQTPAPQAPAAQPQPSEGEWTRAYGSGDKPVHPEPEDDGAAKDQTVSDPYRPPE